jgi:hypothetical protein
MELTMDKQRARQLYELADRLSKLDINSLSEQQLEQRNTMISKLQEEVKTIKEFAPDDGDDGAGGEEDTLHKYARMWYNGNETTQQQVEKILDRMGWEIGELESEEGGAFVVQSGDENGNSYIGFAVADLLEGITDNKDAGEYDQEGDMARQDLATAANAAEELRSILDSDENLPEWVQSKITKAVDYLDTVRDYMKSKDQDVTEASQRVDSLVTDALKIMRGSSMNDAVQALKTVLGDREYNGRRNHYNFYVRQIMDMYSQQGVAEGVEESNVKILQKLLADEGYTYPIGILSRRLKLLSTNQSKVLARLFVNAQRAQDEELKLELIDKIDGVISREAERRSDPWKGVAEGVAETLSMDEAKKVLRHYGADNFKTTSNELHFYKNGRPFSVDLIMNDDATRSVSLSQLNSATRRLKGQGVTETKKTSPKLTPVNIKKTDPVSEEINTEAYERLQKVFAFKNYES